MATVSFAAVAFGQLNAPSLALGESMAPELAIGGTEATLRTPSLSFAYSSNRDTWNTVLLVSGIVFVIGLAEDDGSLEVLGGIGALLSLYETSTTRFHFGPNYREYDLLSRGPVSLGLSSIGRTEHGNLEPVKPCLNYSIRF